MEAHHMGGSFEAVIAVNAQELYSCMSDLSEKDHEYGQLVAIHETESGKSWDVTGRYVSNYLDGFFGNAGDEACLPSWFEGVADDDDIPNGPYSAEQESHDDYRAGRS
jgi:hypothetical protein